MRDGLHLRASVAEIGPPVVLGDEHGPVLVHALPYLDPDAARETLADDEGAGRTACCRARTRRWSPPRCAGCAATWRAGRRARAAS